MPVKKKRLPSKRLAVRQAYGFHCKVDLRERSGEANASGSSPQSTDRDPALNRAFGTFEANKAKQEAKRQKVNHFKEVAAEIVDAAREDSPDPVKAGLEAQKQAKVKEAEKRPLSPEEAREKRLQEHWASDWTPRLEAMKEQAEQEEMNREMELRRGFWTG